MNILSISRDSNYNIKGMAAVLVCTQQKNVITTIDLWLKRISDLIKTLKTTKTLLKVSQIFELRSLVLQGTIKDFKTLDSQYHTSKICISDC